MTLAEIENKILQLQEEIAHLWTVLRQLQQQESKAPPEEVSFVSILGEELFQGSDAVKRGFAGFMAEVGIPDRPVGIEQLQGRMAKLELAPDEFSRAIIETREEQ